LVGGEREKELRYRKWLQPKVRRKKRKRRI